jgi:hypothetical protein
MRIERIDAAYYRARRVGSGLVGALYPGTRQVPRHIQKWGMRGYG